MPDRFYRPPSEERMRGRLLIEWLIVGLLSISAVWGLSRSAIVARADNVLYDAMLTLHARAASSDIVIIAIDEQSLQKIGRWPWPRDIHAALLEKLAAAHPRAIGYDVLFVEPSVNDAALVAATATTAPVVLPMTFVIPGSNGAPFDPELPVPELTRAARVGHAAITADDDGIVRRIGLEAGGGSAVWPHMAEELYRVVAGKPSPAFERLKGDALPADRFTIGGAVLIPLAGPAGSYRTIPFASVLNGEAPPELFTGRTVLVGSTASGPDHYAMPNGTMPGVEVIANTLDSLVAGRSISIAGPRAALSFALAPLVLLLLGFLLLPPRLNLLFGLVLIALTLIVSGAALLIGEVWLPPAAQLIGLLLVYPVWAWRRLEAASAYMTRELRQLDTEPDDLPGRETPPLVRSFPHEAIEQQTAMLHNAIVRVRDLRRFFADSVQGLPDPTLILAKNGTVMLANREAETLFQPLLGEGRAPALGMLLAHLSTDEAGVATARHDREIKANDGRIFVFRLVPLLAAEGEQVGSIARLTDITTIRLATRQREEALELLTHDMRSPQASILALLENTGEDATAVKDRIGGYARRTLELAENFVQLARAEARNFQEELLDLSSLVMDAIDDQWVLASKAGIRISSAAEEEEHLLCGDRSLLTRALVNVIGNALKYSEAGTEVRCTLETAARVPGGPAMILCKIKDQGRGIPTDQLDTLFERYQRLASAGRRDAGGAGLGLSFVRTVINRHGGAIEATSADGEGSTFWIWLPPAPEACVASGSCGATFV